MQWLDGFYILLSKASGCQQESLSTLWSLPNTMLHLSPDSLGNKANLISYLHVLLTNNNYTTYFKTFWQTQNPCLDHDLHTTYSSAHSCLKIIFDQALCTKEADPYLVLCLATTLLSVLWRFVEAAGNGFFTAILQNKTNLIIEIPNYLIL